MYYFLLPSIIYFYWMAFCLQTENGKSGFLFKFLPFVIAAVQTIVFLKLAEVF